MKTVTILMLVISLFAQASAYAQDQKRTQNWYFGDRAGLSFATDPPTVLTDGQMYALEGCATISDTAGNLLFYTNGQTVWNRSHQIMLNGNGLLGESSSSQAALIVPQPGNDSIFFIFTTGTNKPLYYSTVNILLDSGRGLLVEKNLFLANTRTEKLASTYHNNGVDIWIVTHEFNTNNYYSFLITNNGVINCPIISSVGSVMGPSVFTTQGEMKFSSAGNLLAVSFFNLRFSELLQFNRESGKLHSPLKILSGLTGADYPVSAEFSPSGNKLYITERDYRLVQYAIDTLNEQIINNSRIIIYSSPLVRTLKLSLNREILCGFENSDQIGVIEYPDSTGILCNFVSNKYSVYPRTSTYNSSPNFVSSYFYRPSADFGYILDCKTNRAVITATDTISATSYYWNVTKTGTETYIGNPLNYQFTDTGNYTIELLAINSSDTARRSKQVFIYPAYSLNLGNDTFLCSGQTLQLNAGIGQHCYLWNDSSNGTTLTVDTSGLYYVKVVSNGFCTYFDSIKISLVHSTGIIISITRKADTLFASETFPKYKWYRNNQLIQDSTLHYILLTSQGDYQVTGSDTLGCFDVGSDIFQVDTLTSVSFLTDIRIRIYPNPAYLGSKIFIEPDGKEVHSMELYSIEGKLIWNAEQISGDIIIHTEQFNSGIYILNINHLYNYKIIIK